MVCIKKIASGLFAFVIAFVVAGNAFAASYYAGVFNTSANRGISATIKTPTSLPSVSDSGESVWVSSGINSNGQWIQTGTRYYKGYSGFNTYTEHYKNGVYTMTEIGSHVLNFQVTYRVEYLASDSKWHAYIAGVEKAQSTLSTVTNVQAQSEVHKLNIRMGPFAFSNVQAKNSGNIWNNNTVSPSAQTPYVVSGSATSYTVSGP